MIENCIFCNNKLFKIKNSQENKIEIKCNNNICMFPETNEYMSSSRFHIWLQDSKIYNYVIRFYKNEKKYTLVGRDLSNENKEIYTAIRYYYEDIFLIKVNYFIPIQININYINNLIDRLFKLKLY